MTAIIDYKRHALGYGEGDRVRIHPATDWYMRGLRFATVRKIGRKYVHLESDCGRRVRLPFSLILRKA